MISNANMGTWIQCQNCGKIYHIAHDVPIDKLYVASECPRCGNYKGLNCGTNPDDFYLYANLNLDGRYYKY